MPFLFHWTQFREITEISFRLGREFDIYGKFRIDIVRENDRWVAYRAEEGKRLRLDMLVIPSSLSEEELATYLDDLYHEAGGPGQTVRRIPDESR